MAVIYNITAINARLQAVADVIDESGNGNFILRQGTTNLSTISLARPCGTVDGGVLTFVGTLLDPSAAATGTVDNAIITDGAGVTIVSGLSVGIPLSGYDVIISNGLNSTVITAGQVIELISAQITGS